MANQALQKRCLCCGAISPDSAPTCPKCGEGSWMSVILPATVTARAEPVEPTATVAPSYHCKGRK